MKTVLHRPRPDVQAMTPRRLSLLLTGGALAGPQFLGRVLRSGRVPRRLLVHRSSAQRAQQWRLRLDPDRELCCRRGDVRRSRRRRPSHPGWSWFGVGAAPADGLRRRARRRWHLPHGSRVRVPARNACGHAQRDQLARRGAWPRLLRRLRRARGRVLRVRPSLQRPGPAGVALVLDRGRTGEPRPRRRAECRRPRRALPATLARGHRRLRMEFERHQRHALTGRSRP